MDFWLIGLAIRYKFLTQFLSSGHETAKRFELLPLKRLRVLLTFYHHSNIILYASNDTYGYLIQIYFQSLYILLIYTRTPIKK